RITGEGDVGSPHRSTDYDLDVDRLTVRLPHDVFCCPLQRRVKLRRVDERRRAALDVEAASHEGVFAALGQQHAVDYERLLGAVDVHAQVFLTVQLDIR